MPGINLVLTDSDALIGLINPSDPNHDHYLEIQKYLATNNIETHAPLPIVLEASSALARETRLNRPDLATFLLLNHAKIESKPQLDEDVAASIVKSFSKNTSRKNTPFDHYLCALAKQNNIRYIFSFDSFYRKQGLILAEELLKK